MCESVDKHVGDTRICIVACKWCQFRSTDILLERLLQPLIGVLMFHVLDEIRHVILNDIPCLLSILIWRPALKISLHQRYPDTDCYDHIGVAVSKGDTEPRSLRSRNLNASTCLFDLSRNSRPDHSDIKTGLKMDRAWSQVLMLAAA